MEVMNNGKLAQQLVEEAIKNKASDVHVEPLAKEVRVRMRIDGLLQELCRLPWSSYATLVSQLKLAAQCGRAYHRFAPLHLANHKGRKGSSAYPR